MVFSADGANPQADRADAFLFSRLTISLTSPKS
jgi:hypothetical protein